MICSDTSERWKQIVGYSIIIGILGGIFLDVSRPIAKSVEAKTIEVKKEYPVEVTYEWNDERVKEEITKVFPEDPVTAIKIARCESGFMIDAKGPTSDFGLMQINAPSWDKKAKQLGYGDYRTNPVHNLAMARYLYERAGKHYTDWVCYTKKMI